MSLTNQTILGARKRKGALNRAHGLYMVELIMAIAISSMLAAALVSSMGESERLTSYGENQILATTIAQSQIDSTRNIPYETLKLQPLGEYELKTLAHGSVQPMIAPRDVLPDNSKFQGRVFETIALGPYNATRKVTIKVVWTEGTREQKYELSTLVAENGINNSGKVNELTNP